MRMSSRTTTWEPSLGARSRAASPARWSAARFYFLSDNQTHPARIGYWAAGGVLVGTGVGIVQVVVQENRAEQAVSRNFDTDPAPTFRLALFRKSF